MITISPNHHFHHHLSRKDLILVTISLSLGTFMNVLDSSIANVLLPSIVSDLGASPYEGVWVITSFGTSMAIVLPLTGWLAKRFGGVRIFVGATLAFTLASVLCGLAINFPLLIIFRVLQGVAGGIIFPISQSLLLITYPPDKKGLATAAWNIIGIVGPVLGPILGGWIGENFTWPWIFYINLPIGIFSAYVTWKILSKHETPISKTPIDIVGVLLIIISVGALQILLDKGHQLDWFNSNVIVSLCIISIVGFSFLIAWELTEKYPIINLRLFKDKNFTIGTLALSVSFLVLFGNLVLTPLWLQTQLGYTALWSGFTIAPMGLLALFVAPIIGIFINKLNLRVIVSLGFLVFAICSFWNGTFNTTVDYSHLIIPRLIQSAAIPCFFIPLFSILLSRIPDEHITTAVGIATFLRILGGSFGASLSVTLWQHRESFHHVQLVQNTTVLNPFFTQKLQALQNLGFTYPQALSVITNSITKQAFMISINDYFWLSGIIFIFLIILTWFTKPPFLNRLSE